MPAATIIGAGPAGSIAAIVLLAAACSDPTLPDFNNPQLPPSIPTQVALQEQVTGTIAGDTALRCAQKVTDARAAQ